jgi:polysaccharide deacetylase family protein (PEP-CTERM system associated)
MMVQVSSMNAAHLRTAGDAARAPGVAVKPASGRVLNAMTVDVEDYFQVRAFAGVLDRGSWDQLPARVEANTNRMLEIFAEKEAKATFFILGWVAERFPRIVRRMAASGHEIASHGYAHQNIDTQTQAEFRDDIRRAKALLEDIGGTAVRGYRAPTFSIGPKTWWAYDILAEEGHTYSSSIYPIAHDLYGMPDAPRTPFQPAASPLLEIPMTTVRYGKRNFPASGGGYFRLLPYGVSRRAFARVNREGSPCIFYCHPWEIDPGQPRIAGASLKSRLRHYTNLGLMERRISRLLGDFAWGRMDEVFLTIPAVRTADESRAICPR